MTPDILRAHPKSSRHLTEVLTSEHCGCFQCRQIFPPGSITDWVDSPEGVSQTAVCPHCGIDTVIGSESCCPVTDQFLEQTNPHWF